MLILFKFHYLTIFTLLIVAKHSQTSADIWSTLSVSPALSSPIPFLTSLSSSTSSALSTSSVTILSPTSSILSSVSTTQIMTAKNSGSTAGSTSLTTNSETATRKATTTSATIKGTTTAETTMKGTTPETTKTNYASPTSSIAKETTTGIQTISSITAASASTTAAKSTPSTSLETEKTTTTTTSKSQTETTARKTTERSTKNETVTVTSTTTTTVQTTTCVSPFLIYKNAVITSTSIFLNFTSSTNVAITNVTIQMQNMECNNDHPYIINGTDFINVTNLHPYRTYNVSVTYLDSCFDTEKTTSCSLTTLNSPPDEVDQDEIQSNSTDTEITLWWNLNNTDCMGPTFYIISYFDPVDNSTNYTLYSNPVLQTCSMNCTDYIVFVSFQNLHNNRAYTFEIFPYTNDSSLIKNGTATVYTTQTLRTPAINKLSAGIIVGIVFGVLAFILLILALAYFVFKTYNNKKNTTSIYPLLWEIPENNLVANAQTKKEIRVVEFQQKINEYSDNSWFDIISEFEALKKFAKDSYKYPCESALSDANMPKNRFINVLPYDRSRVELCMPENDYINASFIKGYSGKTEYIATQGPLDVDDQVLRNKKETVPEFWLMIWQQNVTCIVMLTALHEHGRPKSACYWPTQLSNIVTYFHIEISLLEEIDYKKYVCRKFQLQQRNEKRLITHYQYLNWSDMSVIHEDDLLQFTRMIRNSENLRHKPTVVHCSAGVGRTGTFIALDILLQQIQHGFASINIYDCVLKLRQQRVLMVQVEKQYILLYKCVGKIIAEISSTSKDNAEYGNKAGTSLDDEYSFASTTF